MNSASPPRRTGWTEFVLFSILGIATLVAYAREHELPVLVYPGAATLGRALAYGGGAAVGAVVMALVVGLIGRGLWRDPQQPGWAMAATCGWIWIGMVGTLLLLVGGLHRVTAWLILIPALRAAAAIVSHRRVDGLASAGVAEPARTGAADRLWTGLARLLLVTILLIMGACSLAPTIAFDDHVYHLPIVRAFVERGSLWLDSGQPNVYRPALHAVWMAVAELVGGPAVSRLVNIAVWLTLVLLACGTARALVRLGIVAIMALTAQVLVLVDSAYADMGLALLFVAVLEFGVPRDADAAAELPRQVIQAGGVGAELRRDTGHGQRVQRHEDHAQP